MCDDERNEILGKFIYEYSEAKTTHGCLLRKLKDMGRSIQSMSFTFQGSGQIHLPAIRRDLEKYPNREDLKKIVDELEATAKRLRDLDEEKQRLGLNI